MDETGDRGSSGKSSPYFAFACVLVADENEGGLRAVMSGLRAALKVPTGRPLHWNDHVKTFTRRQHVTGQLAALSTVTLNYVLVEKKGIPAAAAMRADQTLFYNFAAGMTLERILLAARHWPGGSRDVIVRFAHVRGFNHTTTTEYFDHRRRTQNPSWLPWGLLRGSVKFEGTALWDGLQAADQYAGMLSAAIKPDPFGNYEPQHFLRVLPQLRCSAKGDAWGYGFKHLGNRASLDALPWWRQTGM